MSKWFLIVLAFFIAIIWVLIYFAHQESKRMGVTEVTNWKFLEPMVNVMTFATIMLVLSYLRYYWRL